jgi:aminoglycoside phosphotransferase (APT) family kinase protein
MTDTKFRYSKEIDALVSEATENALNTTVVSTIKIDQGEVNHVYKVVTDTDTIIVRVFRHQHWPEEGKIPWIEQALTQHDIQHAKTKFYSRKSLYFPNGFMISEYISGKSGSDAILQGDVTFDEFHQKLAILLSQIHAIPIEKYGQINNGKGQFSNFLEYRVSKVSSRMESVRGAEGISDSLIQIIIERVPQLLQPFETRFKPVLVHGDPTPDNTIYTPEGEVILIDWDGALSETWLRDYSWITYWGSHLSKYGDIEERKQRIREAFIASYRALDFSKVEIETIERALHILQAVDLLPYYYADHQKPEAFQRTKDKLFSLLDK